MEAGTIQRLRRSVGALFRAAAGHFPALARRAGKILSILLILSGILYFMPLL